MRRFADRLPTKLLAYLLAVAVPAAYILWPTRAEASHLGSSTASAGNSFLPVQQAVSAFQPDLFTGRATTTISIAVPPGRQGLQPALALQYASSNRNGWLGVGWALELGAIERSTKNGPPAYGAADTFVLTFHGMQAELVKIPDGTYRAKDEGLFLKLTFDGASWTVFDKAGTQYMFGTTSSAQSVTPNGIFRWQLDKVTDVHGNYLEITYTADQGLLYPAEIRYTGHAPTNAAPPHRVVFTWEDRPDIETNYRSGSALTTAKRLKAIAGYANTDQLAHKYVLDYTLSPRTGRSLLTSVTTYGTDGTTSAPPQTFTYQEDALGYLECHCGNPPQNHPDWNIRTASIDLGHDNFGALNPYAGLPWSTPLLDQSGAGSANGGNVSWSIGSDGSIQLRGNSDHHVHAWTYLYNSSGKNLSLSLNKIDCDSNASLWLEDANGLRQVTPGSVGVNAGWSILHVTDYHQHDCFSSQLSGPAPQVEVMNASLFTEPQLMGDFTGDGVADMAVFTPGSGKWEVAIGNRVGFLPKTTWLTGFGGDHDTPLLGDFDGDGKTDIALFNGGTWQFAKSTGNGWIVAAFPSTTTDNGTPLVGDFNGDGLADIGVVTSGGTWLVRLNAGNGAFQSAVTWLSNWGGGQKMIGGDFNGDGFTDVGYIDTNQHVYVALSTGTSFQAQGAAWQANFPGKDTVTTGDLNGDGLTDLAYLSGSQVWAVLSQGTTFGTPFQLFSGFTLSGSAIQLQLADYNGDGMAEAGVFSTATGESQLSFSIFRPPDLLTTVANGVGGTTTLTYMPSSVFNPPASVVTNPPQALAVLPGSVIKSVTFYGDSAGSSYANNAINIHYVGQYTYPNAYASAGIDLAGPTDVTPYQTLVVRAHGLKGGEKFFVHFRDQNWTQYDQVQVRTASIPATGLTTTSQDITFNMGTLDIEHPVDMSKIVNITVEAGGPNWELEPNNPPDSTVVIEGIRLEPQNLYTQTKLPFIIPVVTQVDQADGLGRTYTTRYEYTDGLYDGATREFRGFNRVRVRDADSNYADTWFKQDAALKGRVYLNEQRDSIGRLFAQTAHTWSSRELYPGVTFAFLASTDQWTYDGDADARLSQTDFTYDDYGNITQTFFWGEVQPDQRNTHDGDERIVQTTYNVNPSAWIVGLPSLQKTLATDWTVVAQKRFYYDGATSTATPPTAGQLTKEEEWLVSDVHAPANEQWPATTMTYDPYGNVATVKDALNRTTTNTYDTATHTFLTQITNALQHARSMTYDARLGVVLTSTDPNGQLSQTRYDALGRVTKIIGPTDTDALPTMSYDYDLSTVPTKTVTHARIQSGQSATLDVYAFADGLGRTLQTRSPAEDPAKQVVTGDASFDARGLVSQAYLPYLANVSTSYQAPDTSLATVTYAYDAMGRLLSVTDPDAKTATTTYDDWTVTSTDAKGHQQRNSHDAYGRLVKVEELNGTETYTTTYGYDALNRLATVTDAQAHVTTMTYDSLGRKRSMDDPDMGRWTYAYDAVDNVLNQTDARGVVTAFAYDALNRLTRKSYTLPANSTVAATADVTYTYDDPLKTFSKGKLTAVSDGAGGSGFAYDQLGRLITETKTVDATTYTVSRGYDLLGRMTSLTYPDNERVTYTYNAQGGLETIAGTSTYVSDVDYNAAGQMTRLVNGNGVVSDYTYNPQTLRLDRLKTTGPAGTLQDFTYGFDDVGNVAHITDAVHSGTQSFLYDDLSRLTQASGAYGVESYAYDAVGNMTAKGTMMMSHGRADRSKPHAVTATTDGLTFDYDADGNCLAKRRGTTTLANMTYDAENRLTQAVTSSTPPSQTVTVMLKQGWNFFALPVMPDNLAVASVFPTFAQDLEQVARYEPDGTFKRFVSADPTDASYNDFTALEYDRGYEIYCTNPTGMTVTITGRPPSNAVSSSLATGWHLIGSTATSGTQRLQDLLGNLVAGLDYDVVKRYDAVSRSLTTVPVATTNIAAGEAVYVHCLRSVTWTPTIPAVTTSTTSFVYDGDGGRVKQVTLAGTTTYLGDLYEVSGVTSTKHVFAGGLRIASVTTTGATRTPVFYHGDHLGSANLVTDGAGHVVSETEYKPFGELAQNTSLPTTGFGFTGQRFDASTGLYFYHARYYDPSLGCFLSPDPFVQAPGDPQTLNRYAYARNNPVKYVDPTGYFFGLDDLFFAIFIIATVISASLQIGATIASLTGHPRAAERLGKASQISGYVAAAASVFNIFAAAASGAGNIGAEEAAQAAKGQQIAAMRALDPLIKLSQAAAIANRLLPSEVHQVEQTMLQSPRVMAAEGLGRAVYETRHFVQFVQSSRVQQPGYQLFVFPGDPSQRVYHAYPNGQLELAPTPHPGLDAFHETLADLGPSMYGLLLGYAGLASGVTEFAIGATALGGVSTIQDIAGLHAGRSHALDVTLSAGSLLPEPIGTTIGTMDFIRRILHKEQVEQ